MPLIDSGPTGFPFLSIIKQQGQYEDAAAAAARIRAAFPNDRLILVSKQTGQVIP